MKVRGSHSVTKKTEQGQKKPAEVFGVGKSPNCGSGAGTTLGKGRVFLSG